MKEIDFPLACASCGGELQGRALHADCPHCQRPVAETIHPDYIDSASWTVSVDVLCVGCGYNLRTLAVASVCPECAHPVVASLRPNELRFADRTWRRRVWLGVRCLIIAGIGAAAAVFMFVLVGLLGSSPGWAIIAGLGILSVALALLACVGVVLATRSPPRFDPQRGSNIPRNLARVAISLPLLTIAVGAINPMIAAFSTSVPMIAAAGGLAFTMACLRRVGVRARQRGLVTLTTVVIWLGGAAGVFGIASSVALAVLMPRMMLWAATSTTVTAPQGTVQPTGTVAGTPQASNSNSTANRPDSATIVTSVASTSGGKTRAVVVTSVSPMGAAPMPFNPLLMSLFGIASCAMVLLALVTFIIALVALFKYDRLLGTAIRQSGRASNTAAEET